ncbi:LysE family transporter [Aeromicrobium sp.]|nr:LysE family transporter [Candidatus Saccharibacteria bacterium]
MIQNFWLGFVITATPGAVLVEALRRSIGTGNYLVIFLAGNFIGMTIVIMLAFFGISVLQDSVTGNLFFLISGSILIYIGVLALVAKPHNQKSNTIVKHSEVRSLLTGITLAVANPLSFIFWLSLIGGLRSDNTPSMTLLDILAVMFGALAVFVILIILAKNLRSVITLQRERILSRVFGTIITFYGLAILYKSVA